MDLSWLKELLKSPPGILMVLSFILIISSLFTKISFYTNQFFFFLGLGVFFIGFGEHISIRIYTELSPPNAYTGGAMIQWTTKKREIGFSGILCYIIGFFFLILSTFNIS